VGIEAGRTIKSGGTKLDTAPGRDGHTRLHGFRPRALSSKPVTAASMWPRLSAPSRTGL
jgi:hypothetical protein